VSKEESLKQKILHAHKDEDIASLYMMEQEAHETFDEETLHGFYANILDLALEKLTNTLEAHRKMDMQDVQDFATLRALYEYAIEHYSADDKPSAAALFEVLSGLSNDPKFSDAMKIHWIAAQENLVFENFLDTIADIDATQKAGTFYIGEFQQKAQELLEKTQKKGK